MGTAKAMLAEATKSIGLSGRPNYVTRDYAARHGSAFLKAPWCDMSITYWARRSDTTKAVLPAGDRAYTVWHARDFVAVKRWHTGTSLNIKQHAKAGDIVFFDWGASNATGNIDHVGIVTANLGDGRVATIEGNTGDACKRRVRGADVIAGFGQPAYSSAASSPKPASVSAPAGLPMLRKGAEGERVRQLQRALIAAGHSLPRYGVDGDFGKETQTAVYAFQRAHSLTADGIYGPRTAAALAKAVGKAGK